MFPQSLGFIPKECVNEYHGNDSLGFSSRGWWEMIPRLVITPSWLRPWCTTNKKCSAYNKILKSSVYIKYKLAFNECSSTVYLAAYVFIIHGWAHTMLNSMLISSSLALREAINCSELNTTPSLMKRLFTMAKAKAFWVSATKVAFYPPNGALDWESTVAKPSTGK